MTYHRGDPEEGERLCRQARTWFERTGDSYFQVQNLVQGLAVFALHTGRPDEAEAWLREAMPVALQIGGWVAVEAYRYLAEALVAQDRLDDAREIVAFAARNVPEEDVYARSALLLAGGGAAGAAGGGGRGGAGADGARAVAPRVRRPRGCARGARTGTGDLRRHGREHAAEGDRCRAGGARQGA